MRERERERECIVNTPIVDNETMLKSGSTALLLAGATMSGQALLYTLRSHTARTLQQKHRPIRYFHKPLPVPQAAKVLRENHRENTGGGTRGANNWAMYGIFALIGAKSMVVGFSHAEAVL